MLAGKYEVQDNPLVTAHLTEGEHNALLAEVRVQASLTAEGVQPRPLTLQEKTSARSLCRVAAWKTSNFIDPSDETEFAAPTPSQVDSWYRNYKALKHDAPLPSFDPHAEQTSSTSAHIVPSRRFASDNVWQMFPWLLQEDTLHLPVEVSGPATWEARGSCLCVYEAILLLLRVDDDDPGSCVATPSVFVRGRLQ